MRLQKQNPCPMPTGLRSGPRWACFQIRIDASFMHGAGSGADVPSEVLSLGMHLSFERGKPQKTRWYHRVP